MVRPCDRYDFDLRTGESETGLKACAYAVRLAPDVSNGDGVDYIWVEKPSGDSIWRVVELRPVSEGRLFSVTRTCPSSSFRRVCGPALTRRKYL